MQIKTSRQSFDHLFTAKPVDVQARAQFEARVGWRYGLAFGLVLLIIAWGVDAIELAFAHAAIFPLKLILALLLVLPLTVVAGAMAGHAHGALGRKLLGWTIVGGLIGFLTIHIPFDGVSLVAALLDPATRGIPVVPFTPGAQERVVALVAFGAVGGVFIGVLQALATAWAWDRSTAENRMTIGGWVALLVSLPLAIALGAVFDGASNSQLRGPLYTTHRVIQLALNTPPDLPLQGMDTGKMLDYLATQRWREHFTPDYVQEVADFDPATLTWAFVDARFSNGFIMRCQVTRNGEILQSCIDLKQTAGDWMTQFLTQGTVHSETQNIRIDKAALDWRAQQSTGLAPSQVTVADHRGRVVVITAQLAQGRQVECRFVGANPTVIHDCASK